MRIVEGLGFLGANPRVKGRALALALAVAVTVGWGGALPAPRLVAVARRGRTRMVAASTPLAVVVAREVASLALSPSCV